MYDVASKKPEGRYPVVVFCVINSFQLSDIYQ